MPEELNLSNLKPASARKGRKRVGRGMGSGKGRYAGRGIKGQKARSGSHKMRAGFEGGQMPIYMRLGKLRGEQAHKGPVAMHGTQTQPVNVRDLDRFDDGADVTPEALVEVGLIRNTRIDVKILGQGDLKKKLAVTAHFFSASAREKIEAAGGSVTQLKEPKARKQRKARPAGGTSEAAADEQAATPEAEASEPEAPAEEA